MDKCVAWINAIMIKATNVSNTENGLGWCKVVMVKTLAAIYCLFTEGFLTIQTHECVKNIKNISGIESL